MTKLRNRKKNMGQTKLIVVVEKHLKVPLDDDRDCPFQVGGLES